MGGPGQQVDAALSPEAGGGCHDAKVDKATARR